MASATNNFDIVITRFEIGFKHFALSSDIVCQYFVDKHFSDGRHRHLAIFNDPISAMHFASKHVHRIA